MNEIIEFIWNNDFASKKFSFVENIFKFICLRFSTILFNVNDTIVACVSKIQFGWKLSPYLGLPDP